MAFRLKNSMTMPALGLLLILLCSVVRSAPTEPKDVVNAEEDKELVKNAPGDILSEDQSNQIPDVNIDEIKQDTQKLTQNTPEESDSAADSEEADKDNDDFSIVDPNKLDGNLQDNSGESLPYSFYGESKDYTDDSSFFKSSDNDFDFMANYEANTDENERKVEEMLCAVLDMCDWNTNTQQTYQWGSDYSSDVTDNEIQIDAEPLPKVDVSRAKRSADDDSETKHRSKRDLSWFDEANDDDIVPYDVLAEVLSNDDNVPVDTPQNNLVDMLDYIEGVRRDRMTAGDILAEFEDDEAMGGMPFVDDTGYRKRSMSRQDMKHFVQSLPTLEGMKKRSDQGIDFENLNDFDIVAAENELAAEELQDIETKAQVAAAMLDNAAMLISVIENMAVELVGEYLGLTGDEVHSNGVDLDEFPQYLPPVPPVSVEKRIGRERGIRLPGAYDVPFVPEDRPFQSAYETSSRPRVWNPPTGYRSSSYRRPSQSRYRSLGKPPVSPPFLGAHIGIFPNDDVIGMKYRRVQPFHNDFDNFPVHTKSFSPQERSILDVIGRREKPKLFPVNDNALGRYGSNGRPYLDGYFSDNKFGRDTPVEAGLQDAFDAAALMQDRLAARENYDLEPAIDDAYLGDLMSSIFRNRIRK